MDYPFRLESPASQASPLPQIDGHFSSFQRDGIAAVKTSILDRMKSQPLFGLTASARSLFDISNMNGVTCYFQHADHAYVFTLILFGLFLIIKQIRTPR